MSEGIYTVGAWQVKDGKLDDFVEAWKALGEYFRSLPHPPGQGRLLQSVDEPNTFYSFGPWDSLDDIEEMRSRPETRTELAKLTELCEQGRPGTFRVVATA